MRIGVDFGGTKIEATLFDPDLAPLDRRLIDVALLTADERAYVDAYHAEVLAKVGPLLADGVQKDEAALAWLKAQTAPL